MIGIIGGTGLGDALGVLGKGEAHDVDTPFGKPSAPLVTTEVDGVPVALLARHGDGHLLNPSRVPYRANIFALKSLGVTQILASGAVGSLRDEMKPRDLVVPDQLVDRTFRRAGTFYEELAVHVEFASPFCPQLRKALLGVGRAHDRGTYVCMEGPQFSTRAESELHRSWGADLIGMTALPEAKLAREAQLCYAVVALATDYDVWREGEGVSVEAVVATLRANAARAEKLVALAAGALRDAPECPCHRALRNAIMTSPDAITAAARERLALLLGDGA